MNRSPSAAREVGLEPGVVPLGGGDGQLVQRPAVQRQPPPVERAHLVGDGDVGVQVGVPGAGVAVGERCGDQPLNVDLGDPVPSGAGERRGPLQPAHRVGDRGRVRRLDLLGDAAGGERPQRGDALHRGEGEVVAGDRGGLLPGRAGDEPGQLTRVRRGPAELGGEQLGGDFGADPGPLGRRHRPVPRQARVGVPGFEPLRQPAAEVVDPVVDPERGAEAGRRLDRRRPVPGGGELVLEPVGVGMAALAEQRPHLRLGHRAGHQEIWHGGAAMPHPDARRLPLLRVVVAQAAVAAGRRVVRGHLPRQIRIAVARGQLVQAHHALDAASRCGAVTRS